MGKGFALVMFSAIILGLYFLMQWIKTKEVLDIIIVAFGLAWIFVLIRIIGYYHKVKTDG